MIEALKTIIESMKTIIVTKLNMFGFEGIPALIVFITVIAIKIMPRRSRRR